MQPLAGNLVHVLLSTSRSCRKAWPCSAPVASGYSNWYIQPALLHRAVELVAMGEVWLGRSLVDHLLRNQEKIMPATEIETETKAKASYASLTLRERKWPGWWRMALQ